MMINGRKQQWKTEKKKVIFKKKITISFCMFDINFFGNKKNEAKSLTTVRDRPIKSIAKAVSWRIVGSIDTIFISYILTGKIKIAFSIGGVEVFTKIFLYN